ncbi:MAG: benzoyl-CoA reductase, bzd-type, subunit Q [Desulfobacteraceae bacterium]|nr:MAG: benzoyl-CoA reductase, bzd-type, subunit Q [Desulfobacteraceae bacterium]
MSEHTSINEKLDWKRAERIVAGIDGGALNSKALILLDGEPYAFSRIRNRPVGESVARVFYALLDRCGMKEHDIHYVVATGCGRMQVPFAAKTVTEVACSAAGAVRVWGPSVRTVLDAGAQSCKVVHCTGKGRATSFLWNDKCAAGIGRSMEVFADLVGRQLSEIGKIALRTEEFPKVSDFCAVYAQSEILDFMRSNVPLEQAVTAYHYGMAKRISTLVARAGVQEDFVIIGGLAKNPGITQWVERLLNVNRLAPKPDWDPTFTTALGAALFADGLLMRQRAGK